MKKWIGEGVLRVEGKDYGYGEEIPTKGISKERIAQLTKLGYIGEIPVAGPNPEILKLTAEVEALKEALEKEKAKTKQVFVKNQELIASNRKLTAEVEALKLEIKTDPGPQEPGAGPINAKPKGGKDK